MTETISRKLIEPLTGYWNSIRLSELCEIEPEGPNDETLSAHRYRRAREAMGTAW